LIDGHCATGRSAPRGKQLHGTCAERRCGNTGLCTGQTDGSDVAAGEVRRATE
jgi:hypothetical protein